MRVLRAAPDQPSSLRQFVYQEDSISSSSEEGEDAALVPAAQFASLDKGSKDELLSACETMFSKFCDSFCFDATPFQKLPGSRQVQVHAILLWLDSEAGLAAVAACEEFSSFESMLTAWAMEKVCIAPEQG